MAFRIPRGYDVNRPPYQELNEGVRPGPQAVPTEAWTGLPPVRVDEIHDDPIVIDAGTLVGIATGGLASGKIFPAHGCTGNLHLAGQSSDLTKWGISDNGTKTAAVLTDGPVLPLGVVYNPVYSFNLQAQYENYKRNENIGFVTDYVIQVPVVTDREHLIRDGDLVMVSLVGGDGGAPDGTLDGSTVVDAEFGSPDNLLIGVNKLIGHFQKYNDTAAGLKFVVGRCLKAITFASGTGSTKLADDFANISLSAAGQAEFKDLDKVQTVPGLAIAGSGTSGIHGWLRDARSSAGGEYKMLNILIRL